MTSIAEPGVFIVDDVAFIQERHGFEIGEAIARRGISKKYYLETRGDVLLHGRGIDCSASSSNPIMEGPWCRFRREA
jgi:hopanoid C-3 methylase